MLYCESYSAYELALIYLYNDEYKNVEAWTDVSEPLRGR